MKTYEITVNDKTYIVKAREINPDELPKQTKTETSSPSSDTSAGTGLKITAPLSGNILEIKVSKGMSVQKGQVLCLLEAMKMENEIMAPQDGTVTAVHISKNQQVESGTVLIEL